MLDHCRHGTTADVEVIPIQKIDEAYERMLKGDLRNRFSIDMSTLVVGASVTRECVVRARTEPALRWSTP